MARNGALRVFTPGPNWNWEKVVAGVYRNGWGDQIEYIHRRFYSPGWFVTLCHQERASDVYRTLSEAKQAVSKYRRDNRSQS